MPSKQNVLFVSVARKRLTRHSSAGYKDISRGLHLFLFMCIQNILFVHFCITHRRVLPQHAWSQVVVNVLHFYIQLFYWKVSGVEMQKMVRRK